MYDFSVLDAFGIAGVALYLGAYSALQTGFLRGHGYLYAGLNALAAALVLASLQNNFNLSSAVIQVSWIVISVVGIVRYYVLTHKTRFNTEEQALVDEHFPGLEKMHARQLLDLGRWSESAPGTVLAREGEALEDLCYLASGKAEVNTGGSVVATLGPGSLVGDVTSITGEPATASVLVSEPARYFALSTERLRSLIQRNAEIRHHLSAALSSQVSSKLVNANRSLAGFHRQAEADDGSGQRGA